MGRKATSIAGLFDVPESPRIAAQIIAGSVHPCLSWIRRVLPMADAKPASRGNATNDGSQPIARAALLTNDRTGLGRTSTGNGMNAIGRAAGSSFTGSTASARAATSTQIEAFSVLAA